MVHIADDALQRPEITGNDRTAIQGERKLLSITASSPTRLQEMGSTMSIYNEQVIDNMRGTDFRPL